MQMHSVGGKDIYDLWPFIEDGVQNIIDNLEDKERIVKGEIKPIYIYEKILNGDRLVILCLDDYEVLNGFFMIDISMIDGEKVLIPHTVSLKHLFEYTGLGLNVLDDLAKKYSCDRIEIQTEDYGWVDIAKQSGFKYHGTKKTNGTKCHIIQRGIKNGYES